MAELTTQQICDQMSDTFSRLNDAIISINETLKQYNEMIAQENEELDEELDEDEVKFDVNGDEIITEEYEPDFDDDEFYHQMHAHNHDDFGYRPFGCGDLL